MPVYTPLPRKKAKQVKRALATPAGKAAVYGQKKPSTALVKRTGGNPYGSLGPSPNRVAKVNQAIVRTLPKVKTTVTRRPPLDPLTQLFNSYRSQILSEDEMQKKAEQWVSNQLNPSLDLVKQQAAAQRLEAASRRDAMQAAYMAAANANAQMAPQVLAGFTSAASTLGSLAGAATGQVGAAQRADIAANQQALANVGQQLSVADPAQQQGVEQYTSGYLPAANIAQMGAFAQGGFLGQVADQRMQAVAKPWAAYNDVISKLDESELEDLRELAFKKPELVGDVLQTLREQTETAQTNMLKIQQERADLRNQQAKLDQADAKLRFEYRKALQKAKTDAEKHALNEWYKNQQVQLGIARNNISQQNADLAGQRLDVSWYNATTSRQRANAQRVKDAAKAQGFEPLAQVVAQMGRSRRDKPKGQDAKIVKALYQQYHRSVAPAQRKELLRAINRWVKALPIRESGKTSVFQPK